MRQLASVWRLYNEAGATPSRPHMNVSGRPFSVSEKDHVSVYTGSLVLGLLIRGRDGRECDRDRDLRRK
jgi:hypothetical protein